MIVALVAGTVLRALHLTTTIGTIDAVLWTRFSELIASVGILNAYEHSRLLNHPPLALVIARATQAIGGAFGVEFHNGFRALQSMADVITTVALLRIAHHVPGRTATATPALFFFLSPAAIFISAFHCNSDPLMMMFLVLAVAAVLAERPALAGLLLACATGIKIVPLLAGPLFLLALRDRRARLVFLGTAAVTSGVIFLPAVAAKGSLFLEQVFGYAGVIRSWGFPLLLQLLTTTERGQVAPVAILPWLLMATLGLLWVAEMRRGAAAVDPSRLPALVGLTYLIALFLAPGFGVQYLFWLLPFALFALPRPAALLLHGAVSVYLFSIYTAWSGGWPWWYAEESTSPRIREALVKGGLVLWALLGALAVVAAWRLYAPAPRAHRT